MIKTVQTFEIEIIPTLSPWHENKSSHGNFVSFGFYRLIAQSLSAVAETEDKTHDEIDKCPWKMQ